MSATHKLGTVLGGVKETEPDPHFLAYNSLRVMGPMLDQFMST